MHPTLKRDAAVRACMARFDGKPYHPAKRHCGKLAALAMHRMGRAATLLNASRHTTEAGAIKYIRRTGFASLTDLMDATGLERIAPAAALPGDIIALQSRDAFGCSLAVALGDGMVLGLLEGAAGFGPFVPHAFVAAWRV